MVAGNFSEVIFQLRARLCQPLRDNASYIVILSEAKSLRFSVPIAHGNKPRCFASLNMTEQKNREENKFSSRVEVRVVTPKAFGAVDQAWGVSASFSSLIFSLLLFSSSPSTNSPLSSATRAELCEELGMTSLNEFS